MGIFVNKGRLYSIKSSLENKKRKMSDGVVDAKLVEEMTIEGEEEAPEVEVAEGEPAEGGEGAAKKKKKKKKKKKNTEANQQNAEADGAEVKVEGEQNEEDG